MLTMLSKNWWMLAVRGIAAILLGVFTILFPTIAIESLVLIFGAYALVDGVFAVISALQHRTQTNWWLHLLEGALGIVAGIVVFTYPIFSSIAAALFVLYVVAFWSITTGIMEIGSAIELRKQIDNEWLLGLSGVLSLGFGILLILFPGSGILTLLWLLGVYAVAFGVVLVVLAFRLRGHQPGSHQGMRTPNPV